MNTPTDYFTYPQETWDAAKCAKVARSNPRNAFGDRNPWPGQIACHSSTCAEYGQTIRYNGGCIRDGEWYAGEVRPLPIIPAGWEFLNRPTWGTYLVKSVAVPA